ncbi:endo alpha-1,4 polygalactosaminidase [Catellatospora tritici]|uniref:endo alpha-1,4 polygalactosaminidase n=1 Tax=Catellatospora tritici TaxID=2851566 RepID=UPI00266F1E34|nr:endo alpha-1,4 polygalactosaminidase [Catellatospora tritici]MBV1856338.1 endo alpha-1,4 polygalactosaminidase [Catellatospora tritici]
MAAAGVALNPSPASAATSVLTPSSLTTSAGTVGGGQPVTNLNVQDQSGTQDTWSKYVEFGGAYSGQLTYAVPGGVSASAVTGIQAKINYRGPDAATQPWTFKLKNWSTGTWTTIGSNASASDWGPWTLLTLSAGGTLADYISSSGAIQLQLTAGNDDDAADLDYAAIVLTYPAGADTTAPSTPANLAVTSVTSSSVSLSWSAASDDTAVTAYDLYQGGGPSPVASVTGTTATVTGLAASTAYTFTVKARDAAGNVSAASASATGTTSAAADTTAPSVPSGLVVTGVSASSVSLSWTASTDNVAVTGYQIHIDGATTPAATVTGLTATLTGLTPATTYTFTVKAKDAAGNTSAASTGATGTTSAAADTTAPSAPSGLVVTGVSTSSVSLSWTASTDNVAVTGYQIHIDGATTPATTVTGLTATLTGLTPATTYTFTVKAKDAAGNTSAASTGATGTTSAASGGTTTLTPASLTTSAGQLGSGQSVTNLTVQDQSGTQDTWTKYIEFMGAYSGYLGYTVPGGVSPSSVSAIQLKINYRGPDAATQTWTFKLKNWTTNTWTTVGSTAAASDWGPWTLYTFATSGTPADYISTTGAVQVQVVAANASDNADIDYAAIVLTTSSTPDTTAPSVPSGLVVTGVSATSVSLSWTASTDNVAVTGYQIHIDGATTPAATVTTTTATLTGLTPATTYTFTVKAKDAAGNTSAASAPVTATPVDTTAPSAPTAVTVTGVSTTSVSLSWTAATDNVAVTAYDLFADADATPEATVTGTSATLTGFAPATTIVFIVKARDAAGNTSAASAAVSATTAPTVALPAPVACPGCWHPAVATTWNWVLDPVPSPPYRAVQMYDIDGFAAQAGDVAALHAAGIKAVCYLSVGSREDWRDDAAQFPAAIVGSPLVGWEGENWLDVRDVRQPGSALAALMRARLDMCDAKGFDAVEFDNIDAFVNVTGFPLTGSDQAYYNAWLADEAHTRGMSTVFKNDIAQATLLLPYFDMALNEECHANGECAVYQQFVQAGKPVFIAEYTASPGFCVDSNAANFNGVQLSVNLDDSLFQPCR